MQTLKELALSMVNSLAPLTNWSNAMILSLVSILTPIHTMMIAVGVMIFMDLVTGVWAAKKRGETITSALLRRTVSKIVIYNIAVITGFVLEKYLILGLFPATNWIAGAIGIVEIVSVLENGNSILGDNVFTSLIKKFQNKLGSDNDPQKQAELKTDQQVSKVDKPD